jgi:hypothetical protein
VENALGLIEVDAESDYIWDEEDGLTLWRFKPEGEDADFCPLTSLEVFPAANQGVRLPYARDRITITDQWLNKRGEVDLKGNAVKFMAFVTDNDRQGVPLDEVIDYVKRHLPRQRSARVKPADKPRKKGYRRGGESIITDTRSSPTRTSRTWWARCSASTGPGVPNTTAPDRRRRRPQAG